MSRIGKQPVVVPQGVTVSIDGYTVKVKGPRGELVLRINPAISVTQKDQELICEVAHPSKKSGAFWGTTRANLANIVKGVTEGFEKKLELHGVGYRATLKGRDLELALGFSHPVLVKAPEGISFVVEKELVTVVGNDPVVVGQVAADIRKIRPPEPYKGKGVHYQGEKIRRKVGKVVGSTG